MVQEYVSGGDLHRHLPALRRDHNRVFAVFARIVDAVAHMHSHGFVHNDIKADNILMTKDGVPKLSDFGLACKVGMPLSGAGTKRYMAPELVSDADSGTDAGASMPASPLQDVWSLGVVLFTMLTGEFPWKRAVHSDAQYMRMQSTGFEFSSLNAAERTVCCLMLV